MNAMQALGWLEKDKEGGHYWFPGPKARDYLRVPDGRTRQRPQISPIHNKRVISEKSDPIDRAVAVVDVHSTGDEMRRRRRKLLRSIIKYIREEGEVSPSQIRGKFYPGADVADAEPHDDADTVGYGSERSWWKNFVYSALSDIDLVETGGEGSHTWFYVGEA